MFTSFILGWGGFRKDFVSIPLILEKSLSFLNSSKIFSKIISPSPWTRISTYGWLSKKSVVLPGTCGPPKIIRQFGLILLIFFANSFVISQFQT